MSMHIIFALHISIAAQELHCIRMKAIEHPKAYTFSVLVKYFVRDRDLIPFLHFISVIQCTIFFLFFELYQV